MVKQPSSHFDRHFHEMRDSGILLSPSRLDSLHVKSSPIEDDEASIDRSRFLRLTEENDEDDEDHFDRFEKRAEYIKKYVDYSKPTEIQTEEIRKSTGNWLLDMFLIRDKDILRKRGKDAVDYLTFQRYIIIFLMVLTGICLCIILPVNLQGTEAYLMCHFSNTIDADNEDTCKRTLLIKGIPEAFRSKGKIIREIQKYLPDVNITALQFVYDSRKLKKLLINHDNVLDAKYFCEEYFFNFGVHFEGRPYVLGLFGGLFCCCYCCPKVDGINYYQNEQKQLEDEILEEYKHTLSDPKGLVFITLETEDMALRIIQFANLTRYKRYCCTNCCLDCIWCCKECTKPNTYNTDLKCWDIQYAPFPDDIYCAYAIPLILVISGNLLQVFVRLLTEELPHRTISAKNHSVMVRTFIFLVLMTVILPSLRLTSLITLLRKLVVERKIPITSITTGSGALFTNYVIQSALLSNALELLRVADVFQYFFFFIFFSLTIAEVKFTSEKVLSEIQFGVHYSRMMLVVFIVATYSITTPIITPFGLLFMVLQHAIDRYNIYFVYNSSRIDVQTHSSAIIFFHISLMIMQLRLLSVIELEAKAAALLIVIVLEVILFCVQLYNHYYYGIFSVSVFLIL
ncbi:CSC1-like protein 2 isoform X5 [Leptotrombidium deliense]|uniref:CSC1-like protein 2 isoform X5 n=1 Tax=Leptotrombidium deliense TaxID=299467 RepID=A0A443SL78_9ACAR|nr:CSC1-like protein 2 isoform X5 [Leptotrombidium deliense]